MKFSLLTLAALSTLAAGSLASGSVCAQTYTIKVGGAYIDPRANSTDIKGTMPVNSGGVYYGNVTAVSGASLAVQSQSTLVFSIERAFDQNWSVELLLGYPPKHDVKLRAAAPVVAATPLPSTLAAGLVAQHVASDDGEVIATVRQWSPTVFLNYSFFGAESALRPFVGVGLNYTIFKASTTPTGSDLYQDGPVRISLTDSYGLAFHMGANYKLNKNWLLNASWSTAAVKNNVTIRTDHSQQNASYRFHPSVFSLMVGYSF